MIQVLDVQVYGCKNLVGVVFPETQILFNLDGTVHSNGVAVDVLKTPSKGRWIRFSRKEAAPWIRAARKAQKNSAE